MGDIYTNPPQSRNEAILRATIDGTEYTDPPESRIEDLLLELKEAIEQGGGGGTTVVANPTGEPTDDLNKVQIGSTIYDIPEGAEVEANPTDSASETLTKLKVDNIIYSVPSGGGGGGTSDYTELENKPEINGVTLAGDKSASDLGLVGAETGKGLSSNDYTNADKAIVDGVTSALSGKVDKVQGKGLSTNDFTDAAKDKLDGIAAGAEVNVNADWNASSGEAQILNKPTLGTAAAKNSTNSVTAGSADLVESGAVAAAIGDKATKVSGATSGNFASLTSGGDIADSGKKASDFLPSDTPIPSITNCYQSTDTAETTIADDDYFPFYDTSATAKKKGLLSTLKAFLKTYFDGIYSTFSGSYNDLTDKPTIPDVSGKADITAIGTNETGTTASKAYAVGEHFYKNGKFCTCIQAIAQGATFTLGTNYVEGTIAEHITKPLKLLEITRTTDTSNMYEEIAENVDVSTYDSLIICVKLGSADVSLNIMEISNQYYKAQSYHGDSNNFYGMILIQNKKITKAYINSRWDSTQNYMMQVYGIKY